jgi:L-ascorbate metabolism protein UlaG (beta-lactamase superfamily)
MAKIYWAGQSCFQISVSNGKDNSADIVIDPVGSSTADILLLTNKKLEGGKVRGEPFKIDGPGEYEIKGVFVQGISSSSNTIYIIESEDMRFCHLGNFDQKELTDEQLEKIDGVDILMVPAENEWVQKIIGQIEPKIVIPMLYSSSAKFLKAMGKQSIAPVEKLTIKASALPKEGALEIVVLQP